MKERHFTCPCGKLILKVNEKTGVAVNYFNASEDGLVICPNRLCGRRLALPGWSPLIVRK
jgi:hypothetical protein